MAKVSNLKIARSGSGGTSYYASWTFSGPTTTTNTTAIKKGDIVSIKSGATYYNGAHIPSGVMSRQWYVKSVSGDRAVLGKSTDGAYADINSPVNTKYLTGGTGSSSGSTDASNLDYYEVKWAYRTGDKNAAGTAIWFEGGSSNVETTSATYNAPADATDIKVTVKPVSKKYKSGNTEKSYFIGEAESYALALKWNAPEVPDIPDVEIEKYTLTAKITGIEDPLADVIEFQVYNGTTLFKTGRAPVKTQQAVYTTSITAGGNYRVRARAINDDTSNKSDWSGYSGEEETIPEAMGSIKARAETKDSVRVSWDAIGTAKTYEVEYATKKSYFDSSGEARSTTVTATYAIITGLESGHEWFFRVRAVNDQGESGWSGVVSCIIGTKPEAPTTWSLTTNVSVGEDIWFYWVHNCEDGSNMTESQIKLNINGTEQTVTIAGTVSQEEEDEPIYSYRFNSNSYSEGAKIKWSVRTKGITNEWGDWSVERTVDLWAPPTLTVTTNVETVTERYYCDGSCSYTGACTGHTRTFTGLTRLPLTINAVAGPSSQYAVSYHVTIIANGDYEAEDVLGNPVMVRAGSEVYSKNFINVTNNFDLTISAGDVYLKNGEEYVITIIAGMNSGLIAEYVSSSFTVKWTETDVYPDAGIYIDRTDFSAHITPFAVNHSGVFYNNAVMSVYRRETNGTFTEIATNIANTGLDTVVDPHPTLDYARYRIVATDILTGNVSYEDLPGEPIHEPAIIMQWNQEWNDIYNYRFAEDATEIPEVVGSLLRLPYNIDTSESYNSDVSLVEYIGRSHPVSYYGTQKGESASWSTEIPKADRETLYALRRLAAWQGDVYVREPSGIGYWARVEVSMSIKHLATTIPVSLNITRVEGGV